MGKYYHALHQYPSYLVNQFGLTGLASFYALNRGSSSKRRPRAAFGSVRRPAVRRKIDLDIPVPTYFGRPSETETRNEPTMDRVVAGNSAVKQRASTKRKLTSGKLGRKLQKINDEIIYRWQRIYNYGQNTTAYPSDITQLSNREGGGRLQLSHFTTGTAPNQVNVLPVYLWDLTSWRTENLDGSIPTTPRACCRLAFNSGNNPGWLPVYTQYQTHAVESNSAWQLERSNVEGSTGFPQRQERKALLKWSDMRFCFYGARQHPTRIVMELIQFKDEKYSMDFHDDGDAVVDMDAEDQKDVRGFWLEEVKKLVYHPLDVQNFVRGKAITSLYRESFQIAPDDTTNADVCPPNVVKRIFKRFNRLVNWDWETPDIEEGTGVETQKNELETPAFQVGKQTNLKDYANPNSRIYLYIRAEDVDPVAASAPLHIPGQDAPTLANDIYLSSGANINSLITNMEAAPIPDGTQICGYDWEYNGVTDGQIRELRVPRFCQLPAVAESWSTTTTPSFDIILRQKWVLQQ